MAVAYGNASTRASNSGTSVTVTKPTSTASGDVLLAVVTFSGTFTSETASATGWTNVESTYDSGNDWNVALLYRIAGGSEGTNYTFSWTGSGTCEGTIFRFTGQSGGSTGSNPFKTNAGVNIGRNTSSTTFPSVSYDAEGTGLGIWIAIDNLGGDTITNASGYTERFDNSTSPHIVVASRADTAGTGKTTGTGSTNQTAVCVAIGGCIVDSFVQSVNVGLVTETDSTQAVTKIDPIHVATGLLTETDTAQAVTETHVFVRDVGLLTETDSVTAVTAVDPIHVAVGLVSTTDTTFAVTAVDPIWVAVGLVTTTDATQAVGVSKSLATGLVTEADESLRVVLPQLVAAGLTTETDEAAAHGRHKAVTLGLGW